MDIERAVILHGKPSPVRLGLPGYDPSRANWLGWLADTLKNNGVEAFSLKPKTLLKPDYSDWLRQINGVCHGKGLQRTAMIAHSLGCAAYLRWLSSQRSVGLGSLVLVAPWLGRRVEDGSFSKFSIDKTLGQRVADIVIVNSKDDLGGGVPEAIDEIRAALPQAELVNLNGLGHFVTNNNMDPDYPLGNGLYGSTFPELMRILEDI
ncbi:MAG: alpha/beta hydrolase [Candidatus Nomurabacteria bacterium]|nr:MAG: alpha/beta hydrolase [Candidatus Nomurabacteria bacterium]HRV75934.1 alpha/beta hydrolase [Candidatus Saccharimonadales bacterium]